MRGKKVLGMVLVMAMLATAMPLLSGGAKAESNENSVPSYLVIVRTPYDQDGTEAPAINKTIGNAYQNDRFGVEVIVHVDHYTYVPGTGSKKFDSVVLNITGIGVKGSNAGDYKVKWLEIGSTKFSFAEKNYEGTPHATDYTSGVQATTDPYVAVGLKGSVHHQEIEWFKEISGMVAGTATSLAVDTATGGAAGPLSGLAGGGASYLVETAIDHIFNVNQVGRNYVGSDRDPWSSANYPHTYTALRGVADGSTDDPQKVLLARNLQWNLDDDINDRVHVLTLRATLCYAKYGIVGYVWTPFGVFPKYGWYDEHKISTNVAIYVVPQGMVSEMDTRQGSEMTTERYLSDPACLDSYYLKTTFTNISSYSMPQENTQNTPRTDSGSDSGRIIQLFTGSYYQLDTSEYYYYYRGELPLGDIIDEYKVGFARDNNFDTNEARIWIHTTGDIKVEIEYNGATHTYTIKGGHYRMFVYPITQSTNAYITIQKMDSESDITYYITAYGYYEGYDSGSGGGSGGGPQVHHIIPHYLPRGGMNRILSPPLPDFFYNPGVINFRMSQRFI